MKPWMFAILLTGCAATMPFESFPSEVVKLKVNGLVELDDKSPAEIRKIRDQAIAAEPKVRPLITSKYECALLASIDPDKPWIGLGGWSNPDLGNYEKNYMDGPSLASVDIGNPFLLASLKSIGRQIPQPPGAWEKAATSEVVPEEITVDGPGQKIVCKYRWQGASPTAIFRAMQPGKECMVLDTANAGDLGLPYCKVVKTEGAQAPNQVVSTNLKYKGGPLQNHPKLKVNDLFIHKDSWIPIKVDKIPFKIVVNFYLFKPTSDTTHPDVVEEITVDRASP